LAFIFGAHRTIALWVSMNLAGTALFPSEVARATVVSILASLLATLLPSTLGAWYEGRERNPAPASSSDA
jgi:hypothetical protein